jgi:hypothetical protein
MLHDDLSPKPRRFHVGDPQVGRLDLDVIHRVCVYMARGSKNQASSSLVYTAHIIPAQPTRCSQQTEHRTKSLEQECTLGIPIYIVHTIPYEKDKQQKKHTEKPHPCNISPTSLTNNPLLSFFPNMSSFLHKIDFFHTSHPSRPCAGRYRLMPGMRNPFNEAPAKPNNNIDSKK